MGVLDRRRMQGGGPEIALMVEMSAKCASVLAAPGVVIGDLMQVKVHGGGGVVKVRARSTAPIRCCAAKRPGSSRSRFFAGIVADTVAEHRREPNGGGRSRTKEAALQSSCLVA